MIDKTIQSNTLKVGSFTKGKEMKNTGRLALTLLSAVLVIGGFYLIMYSGKELSLDLRHTKEMTPKQMLIVVPLLAEYFLIAFSFICLAAFIKKGFCNIKSTQEGGVLTGFFLGFLFWFIMGLLFLFLGSGLLVFGVFNRPPGLPLVLVELFAVALILGTLHGVVGFFKEIKRSGNLSRIKP